MSPSVRVCSARVAMFAMVLAAQSAGAFVRESSNWDPSTLPIHYSVNTASAPPSIGPAVALSALQAGEASWAGPSCTTWRTTYDGTSSVAMANSMDNTNVFLWRSDAWPAELGDVSVTIGVTTPVWSVPGFFIDADIQFNNVGFVWSTDGAGSTVDTQSIATHEEGHFLGLAHPPVPSAIMYASYSGGIKRTLTSDDIAGVCTIYPSGGAIPDAGTPPPSADPCAMYTSCDGCTPVNNCGWCADTGQCSTGTSSGPTSGGCSAWGWQPSDCASLPTGPGTDGGSPPPPPTGGAAFGEPCTNPTDCASGGVCLQVTDGTTGTTRSFCSQSCAASNDCTCPRSYHCLSGMDSTGAMISFCVPGTNVCARPANDAGTPRDAGTAHDAGSLHHDATVSPDGMATMEDGSTVTTTAPLSASSGCGCAVPTSGDSHGAAVGLSLALLAVSRRRRRVA